MCLLFLIPLPPQRLRISVILFLIRFGTSNFYLLNLNTFPLGISICNLIMFLTEINNTISRGKTSTMNHRNACIIHNRNSAWYSFPLKFYRYHFCTRHYNSPTYILRHPVRSTYSIILLSDHRLGTVRNSLSSSSLSRHILAFHTEYVSQPRIGNIHT